MGWLWWKNGEALSWASSDIFEGVKRNRICQIKKVVSQETKRLPRDQHAKKGLGGQSFRQVSILLISSLWLMPLDALNHSLISVPFRSVVCILGSIPREAAPVRLSFYLMVVFPRYVFGLAATWAAKSGHWAGTLQWEGELGNFSIWSKSFRFFLNFNMDQSIWEKIHSVPIAP